VNSVIMLMMLLARFCLARLTRMVLVRVSALPCSCMGRCRPEGQCDCHDHIFHLSLPLTLKTSQLAQCVCPRRNANTSCKAVVVKVLRRAIAGTLYATISSAKPYALISIS